MEQLNLQLDNGFYQDIMSETRATGVAQSSPITVSTMKNGCQQGKTAVCISFKAMVDGKPVTVQATTTLRLFVTATQAMLASEGAKS